MAGAADDEPDDAALWAAFLALGDVPDDEFDHERAAELVIRLNERGSPQIVDWAVPLLTDPDPWRRQAAAWALAQHGSREGRPFATQVLPHLAAAARVERDADVRALVVEAIGCSETQSAAPELMRYADDPAAEVRRRVAGTCR